jgi:hypothetical protein
LEICAVAEKGVRKVTLSLKSSFTDIIWSQEADSALEDTLVANKIVAIMIFFMHITITPNVK